MEARFWPFQNVKPDEEWTQFDREYAEFMRTAFAEGYAPREVRVGFAAEQFARLLTRRLGRKWNVEVKESATVRFRG